MTYISTPSFIGKKLGQELKEGKRSSWSQELVQGPLEECCLLFPMAYTGLLVKPMTTSPMVAPSTISWAYSHQRLIKKMSYRQRHFLN